MNTVIMIIGEGILAKLIIKELSSLCQVIHYKDFDFDTPEVVHLGLILYDTWCPPIQRKAEKIFQKKRIPWLHGFVRFGEGVIGPFVQPDIPGCSQCADLRKLLAGEEQIKNLEFQKRLYDNKKSLKDPWSSRTGLLHMTYFLISEVQRFLKSEQLQTENKLYLCNMKTLNSSIHFFLPDPLCSVCGGNIDDSASKAAIQLKACRKVNSKSYRCRTIQDLNKFLFRDYFDHRTGLLNEKIYDLATPFANVGINLPLPTEKEIVGGRTHSFEESERIAILEGLERYCGMKPRAKRTVIYDSFNKLSHIALNPVKLGLHSKEQYEIPGFPFRPFEFNSPINWVWAYSFLEGRSILVPEHIAYYNVGCEKGIVFETSNGCAIGGSLEEAILYGILEVVERDAFLMTWYAKLPLARIDPYSAKDEELQLMIDKLRKVIGFDVFLFNATMENKIPCIWALGKNREQEGINLICTAGAHLDPIKAAKGAIHELASITQRLNRKSKENKRNYVSMLDNPFLVRQMDDHALLNGLPQAEERINFLLDNNRPIKNFVEEFKCNKVDLDLTNELKSIIHVFRKLNLDIIVVNQTSPEILRNGLHCVKVLIPGMLPMTFGHQFTRITGLERIFSVPFKLGFTKTELTYEHINPYPHPFP